MDEQAARFADSRHLLRCGDRNLDVVADAASFDDNEQGGGFEDNAFYTGYQSRCELRLIDQAKDVFHVIDARAFTYGPVSCTH